METQKQIPTTSPANDDDNASVNILPRRVHPVFEIYENSLPCRIRRDGWWLARQDAKVHKKYETSSIQEAP